MNITHLETIEAEIFRLLLWQKLTSVLTPPEYAALEHFGKTYGDTALENRFWTLLAAKKVNIPQLVGDLEKETKSKAQTIRNELFLLPEPSRKKNAPENIQIEEFKRSVAQVSQPWLQSLITIAFWSEVVEKHFSAVEQKQWIHKLSLTSHEQALTEFKKQLEKRTGFAIRTLIKRIQSRLTEKYAQSITGTVEEVRKLNKQKLSQPLVTALKKGDVVKLTQLFQKLQTI